MSERTLPAKPQVVCDALLAQFTWFFIPTFGERFSQLREQPERNSASHKTPNYDSKSHINVNCRSKNKCSQERAADDQTPQKKIGPFLHRISPNVSCQ